MMQSILVKLLIIKDKVMD